LRSKTTYPSRTKYSTAFSSPFRPKYIKAKGIRAEVRFDLILVIGPDLKIEHVKEAIQVFE